MKFNDDITMSIASTVRDVLEGKAPVKKEEVQYPHDMYHPETGEKEVAKDEAEHKALTAKGYTHEKNEVAEPEPKGEKEFKAKHVIKKSGENNDGTVTKEAKHEDEEEKKEGNAFTKALMAARKNGDDDFVVSGKKYKVEDYAEDEEEVKEDADLNEAVDKRKMAKLEKELDRAIDKVGKLFKQVPDELEGSESYEEMGQGLNGLEYGIRMFNSNVGDLDESKEMTDEESEKQKKYQAFFNKALKKFGVDSPAELEGDKKKEFFDYVDKNYEADDEVAESVEEATLSVSAYTGNMKPANIRIKKGKSSSFGGNDITATGSEKDLIAWAVKNLGVIKPKSFKDASRQVHDMHYRS
tara:strand:+ start:848 stop:1909 length:1062 start_codon:yes stop_codon:yes gene_type:complete